MSERLQFIIMAGFALLCFGCGNLTAFIVTRNKWRDEMIERRIARYDWHTGKWARRIAANIAKLPDLLRKA